MPLHPIWFRSSHPPGVVCVGDVMLDRFVYGHVTRVSPEAPIPVCRVQNETAMLGGAGNVVRNLVALGAGVDFVNVVGDDDVPTMLIFCCAIWAGSCIA